MQTTQKKSETSNVRRASFWGSALIAVCAMVIAMANPVLAQTPNKKLSLDAIASAKLSPELAEISARLGATNSASRTVRVIVQFKQVAANSHLARVQNLGGVLHGRLDLVKAGVFTVPVSALREMAGAAEVAFISPDHKLKAADDLTNAAVGADTAYQSGYDGTGFTVAVIDSGINDTNADFSTVNGSGSRVLYHQDFTGTSIKDANGNTVYDTYGHGTHVAGILGGNGKLSNGQYRGVAPNVNLVDLRVLDQNGGGSDSNVIAGIQRAVALKSTYNIRVINLSVGRPIWDYYANDPLCQAVEAAWRAGIVVVVAAGNYGRLSVNGSNGYGTITSPGNDPYVISVGAMKSMGTAARTDDLIASYSSKGPTSYDHVVKPDILAPGNLVKSVIDHGSTLDVAYPANRVIGTYNNLPDYFILSGTSMATPVVSGAAVLLLQKNASLTPDQLKARMMKAAYKTFPTSSVAVDPVTGQTYTS